MFGMNVCDREGIYRIAMLKRDGIEVVWLGWFT